MQTDRRRKKKKKRGRARGGFRLLALLGGLVLAGALGCSGGGGGSDNGVTTADPAAPGTNPPAAAVSGIALPTEVSAISAGGSTVQGAGLARQVRLLAAAQNLPAEADYHQMVTARYVDEPTLEVFGIVETILKAVAQTRYADPANVGSGPYRTIVGWYDEHDGRSEKTLEKWVVQSDMADGVNVVKIWIDDPKESVKAMARILQAPEQDAAGNYLNYGKWSIHARIGAGDGAFGGTFYAEADIEPASGKTILRMLEDFNEPETFGSGTPVVINNRTRAVMHRSATEGYGKAQIANWDYCWQGVDFGAGELSPCESGAVGGIFRLPADTAQYAYNQAYLGLQLLDASGTPGAAVYKDRTSQVEIGYRYGLFDAQNGQSVEKVKTFGFPILYAATDPGNGPAVNRYGYYGAWQGRHQLWAGREGSLPSGTTVRRETRDGTPGESYTTRSFPGALSKRAKVPASLDQITNIPLETYLGDGFEMGFDGSAWNRCGWDPDAPNPGGGTGGYVCNTSFGPVDLDTLVVAPGSRKQVHLNRCDGNGCTELAYDGSDLRTVTGRINNTPQLGGVYTPQAGDRVWAWVGGNIYVVFNGSNWVEKELLAFDQTTWTPSFGSNDRPFTFETGREYYINNKGVNFIVRRVAASGDPAADFAVRMEVQTVARPDDAATFLSGAAYLASPWEQQQKFVLDTSTSSPTYMLLVYAPDGAPAGKSAGQVVDQNYWGLQAYNGNGQPLLDGQSEPLQFNWEYAGNGGWGTLTYLVDAGGSFLYLDDPIQLDPLRLTTLGGTPLDFSLRFDGWMHGLPDMRWELQKNGFDLTPNLRAKIVNIPAGTVATDSQTGASYLIKPLEVGVILPIESGTPSGAPDLAPAAGLDLDAFTVPGWSDIGTMPTGLILKYIEGTPVQ